ncbi:MAG: four helix bundle protein [Persicimonas sp.]
MAAKKPVSKKPHEDWPIWKLGMRLTIEVYRATEDLPSKEMYGFQSQMRRAALSIPSNIAEGAGRRTQGDLRRFLCNARGSLSELETQIKLTKYLKLLDGEVVDHLLETSGHLSRALQAFIDKINV